MKRGTIILLVALVILVLLFGSIALTSKPKQANAEMTVSDFFAAYSADDFEAAMQHTIVAKMNSSAQQSYVIYMRAQALEGPLTINSITNVTGSLSTEVSAAITSGMATLSDNLGIGIDGWTALLVNVTETSSIDNAQANSDFYLLAVHMSGGWYVEPASFQNDPAGWIKEYT
jgi:hypothetical protein